MWRPTHYRFRTRWTMPADPDELFDILRAIERYPDWWPQVRSVDRRGDEARVRVRSALPYDLWLFLRRRREDRPAGILEVEIGGDLEGWGRWVVRGGDRETHLVYEQEVRTRHRLMNLLAPVARWAFVLNHRAMMRRGERGLRAYLLMGRRRPGGSGR